MSDKNKTIKQLLVEFNKIIDWFDDADLDLEQSVTQYKKATKIADEIKARLENLKDELNIKIINS